MCQYFSCIVTKELKVLWLDNSFSHEDIVSKFKLDDSKLKDRDFVRIEIIPKDNNHWTKNKDDWHYKEDEKGTLPKWYSKNIEKIKELCFIEWEKSINIQCFFSGEKKVVKNIKCMAWGNSSVEAWENSSIVARGNSSVVATENSSVEAWGNSSVVARENSSVVARGNSSVVARGNSSVVARGNSSVVAWENSSIVARGNSSVVARGNSSVVAWGNSIIIESEYHSEHSKDKIQLKSDYAHLVVRGSKRAMK